MCHIGKESKEGEGPGTDNPNEEISKGFITNITTSPKYRFSGGSYSVEWTNFAAKILRRAFSTLSSRNN